MLEDVKKSDGPWSCHPWAMGVTAVVCALSPLVLFGKSATSPKAIVKAGIHRLSVNKDAQTFYWRVDTALIRHDTQEMLAILAELDSAHFWSFGAGIGPTDPDSLQFQIVRAMFMHGLDGRGRVTEPCRSGTIRATGEITQKWLDAFDTPPDNWREVTRLLHDAKPAIRLIGLRKVAMFTRIDAEIANALHRVMTTDPYVQITRKPIANTGNRPSPPGLATTDFSFPLREAACQVLNAKGVPCMIDNQELAMAGVREMAKMWVLQSERRKALQDAISLLDPNGPGVRAVRASGTNASPDSAFSAFMRAVDSK